MPTHKVTFEPAGVTVEADPKLYPYGRHGRPGSILDIALAHGVQIEHVCGGVGVCGTCHVLVTAGAENLSPPSEEEQDLIDAVPGSRLNSRIACQAIVQGDVTVTVPEWNRNAATERGSA